MGGGVGGGGDSSEENPVSTNSDSEGGSIVREAPADPTEERGRERAIGKNRREKDEILRLIESPVLRKGGDHPGERSFCTTMEIGNYGYSGIKSF